MRKVTVAAFAVLLLASAAYADHPLNGVYMSMLGQIQDGRYSEAWVGGGQGQLGNTVHAESWNGSDLGQQWMVYCPQLAEPPELLEDTVDEYGNGHRIYRSVYSGGAFWLSGVGAWGNGDPWYFGDMFHYVHTTTMQIVGGQLVGYTTNAQCSGYFNGYENCMQLTIANAAMVGIAGIPPAGYPQLYMQQAGGVGGWCTDPLPGVIGEWGDVWAITMVISDCSTGAVEQSWSTLKNLYR